MITDSQCRAARGLLQWTRADLAAASGVHTNTLYGFELGKRSPIPANLTAIETALVAAGVEFIPENGGGAGVRLKK